MSYREIAERLAEVAWRLNNGEEDPPDWFTEAIVTAYDCGYNEGVDDSSS